MIRYRGFAIAKLGPGETDSYYPWAIGRAGDIFGYAHTRKEAKAQIDRMLAARPELDTTREDANS